MRVCLLWWLRPSALLSGLFLFFAMHLSAQSLARPPQWEVGLELGGAISAMVPSNQSIPYYDQRIGFRVGGYLQRQLPANFALQSGLLYTLRGMYYNPAAFPSGHVRYWDLHGANIPLMIVYRLSARIQLALGVEFNAVLASNLNLMPLPLLQWGPRGSVGFNWSARLRIAAYYTHLLGRLLPLPSAPGQPENYYNNIITGICITYRLTANPAEKAPPLPLPPCPRY